MFVFSLGFFLFCWFCFFFFYFKFCQSSPVFGELRPLVHFDGELLMVSFCCKDVSFLRGGGAGRDCYVGGSYHWFTG